MATSQNWKISSIHQKFEKSQNDEKIENEPPAAILENLMTVRKMVD
jgi:hypothetical protein